MSADHLTDGEGEAMALNANENPASAKPTGST